ncbi:MAG TPA: hypothetical protein VMD47_11445 [Candidatus Acidoferrales bacterium]|nr:hypothetical protein [Candidatus Acidoferrales bacterium]
MIERQETINFTHVPQSKGIGTGTRWILGVGIVIIFCIGGAVVRLSGYNHVWPAEQSMRMNLGQMPK